MINQKIGELRPPKKTGFVSSEERNVFIFKQDGISQRIKKAYLYNVTLANSSCILSYNDDNHCFFHTHSETARGAA